NLSRRLAVAVRDSSPPHLILFASPRTVEAFLESAGDVGRRALSQAAVIAIGPTTANALAAGGIIVAAVADQPTSSSLVAAAVRAIRGQTLWRDASRDPPPDPEDRRRPQTLPFSATPRQPR